MTAIVPLSPGGELDDGALLAAYAPPTEGPWVRVNFVTSIDGSATVDGRSGGLGGPADLRVFDLLRRLCDVVLVAAGTVRAEGYGPMRLPDAAATWRAAHGWAAQPALAIVSASLDLDPESRIFTEAPAEVLVLTGSDADPARRAALDEVATVVDCGEHGADPARLIAALTERDLRVVHCEGGPRLFGDLVAAGVVDELCLTVGPLLEGGHGPRITTATASTPTPMRLAGALRSDHLLLLRYLTAR